MDEITGVINTITPQEAAEKLRALGMKTSPDFIRMGLEQKVLPFGDAIANGNGGYRYYIYSRHQHIGLVIIKNRTSTTKVSNFESEVNFVKRPYCDNFF